MKKNSEKIFLLFLFSVLFVSGCSVTVNTPGINENKPINKETTPAIEKKVEPAETNAKSENKVLRDFRKDDYKPEKFSKAETDVVLKYILGEENRDQYLEITDRVSGAFTKPNAKETLYFVAGCKDEKGKFVSNSTCGHAGWNSDGWIAVFDGTTPVLKIEQPLGSSVEKVTDINGDGINEILSSGGYTGMGIINSSGALGQISDGKYKEIKTFRGYADNCAEGLSKDKKAVAAVIGYAPNADGKMPEFSEEYFQTKCEGDQIGANPQWTKITKKEFDDFFESVS